MLTLLGSHPVCLGNTGEAYVTTKEERRLHLWLWCSISYTGNGFPVFSWTKSNAENIAANATKSGTGQVLFTSTSFVTQQLLANDSGITFYCRITFQTPNISPENDFNRFEYTWNYSFYTMCKQSITEIKIIITLVLRQTQVKTHTQASRQRVTFTSCIYLEQTLYLYIV